MARTRRIGKVGYARILRALLDRPMTETQLRENCGIGHTAAHRIIRAMHHLKLVHIWSWDCTEGTRFVPVFAFGDRPDTPTPSRRPNGRLAGAARFASAKVAPPELLAFADIVRALREPCSAKEVAEAAGVHEHHTRGLIDQMRSLRLVHIASWAWRDRGGPPIALYAIGPNRRDAPRPRPDPDAAQAKFLAAQADRRFQQRVTRALLCPTTCAAPQPQTP